MVAVLRVLAGGTARPAELEQRIPDAGHAVLIRRLRRLHDRQLVVCERRAGIPPTPKTKAAAPEARYTLTDAGLALIEVVTQAGRWEDAWCSAAERAGQPGVLAVRLLADRRTRKVLLAVADEPLTTDALERRISDLSRSALHRRLRELVLAGALQARKAGRARRFDLTPAARSLASVGLSAGRWEWQWDRPDITHALASLSNLLHVIVPASRVSESDTGVCQLRVDVPDASPVDVYLEACNGRVKLLAEAPATPPVAIGAGAPDAWCEALLTSEPAIALSGDAELFEGVTAALRRALEPKPPRTSPTNGPPENL